MTTNKSLPEAGCEVRKNPQGWLERIEGDEVVSYSCSCKKRRDTARFLGLEIWNAPHLQSHLYASREQNSTTKNLFIKGRYELGLSHLRWALGCKKVDLPNFRFRRTNDNQLLKVWGGDYGYMKRQKEERETVAVFNTLEDLVGDVDLLVVQLGVQDYMTRGGACASALKEALQLRQYHAKPTWIFEGGVNFVEGHPAWKAETQQLIAADFETVELGGEPAKAPEVASSSSGYEARSSSSRSKRSFKRESNSNARPRALADTFHGDGDVD